MRRPSPALCGVAIAFVLVLEAAHAQAQGTDWSKIEVKTETLGGGVSVLFGAGGNIGVFVSPDGVLLVDDQFAPLSPKIQAAVKALSDQPIKLVLNTHMHGDHTGGNLPLAQAGAVIVAQDNVRKRLAEGQAAKDSTRARPPAEHGALPVVTFERDLTFHLGDETIHALHVDHAHTDGDVIVKFEKANIIHMGDTYFSAYYPRVDLEAGGSIDGMIAAVDRALPMIDAQTKVIPGHGPVGDLKTLTEYRAMLAGIRDAVQKLVKQKKTLEQAVAAHPTAPWDAKWGSGFIKPDRFAETLFTDLQSVQQHGKK